MLRYEGDDLGHGVEAVIVSFQRVTVAVAVKIVNHRIGSGGLTVSGRQKDSVLTISGKYFRGMRAVKIGFHAT